MNTLYQGDNLSILRALPDASVDLIATDPPFNTGKDWGAFSDKWEGGLKGYLKFMEPRLVECRRVLKDTGSLYLHCDPTASHYLKVMLDGVFGIKQFRNEIVWHYLKTRPRKKDFKKSHCAILRYSKSENYIWLQQYQPLSEKTIKRSGVRKRKAVKKQGKRTLIPTSAISKGAPMCDVWKDIAWLNSTDNERLNYPTQKPRALYERMIKASSNQGDTVLDPFAGSGTTLDAAHTLGRQWIGIDEGDEAINVIQRRLRNRHGLEYDRDYQLCQTT